MEPGICYIKSEFLVEDEKNAADDNCSETWSQWSTFASTLHNTEENNKRKHSEGEGVPTKEQKVVDDSKGNKFKKFDKKDRKRGQNKNRPVYKEDRTLHLCKSYGNIFFEILKSDNKILCHECNKLLSGTNAFTIKRHYKLVHKKDILNDLKENADIGISSKIKKIQHTVKIEIDKNQFLKCCVGLVAVKNLPFGIFDDSDFFKVLISPYERNFDTNISSRNIVDILENSYEKIQQIITERVENKMLSLKFDIATRMDRSILGINIQYIKDFKIYINTIGIIQLKKQHNATYLKEEILTCLKNYKIDIRQIYSSTTDNGANMLKTSQVLQVQQGEEIYDGQSDGENTDSEDNDESIHKTLVSILSVIRCAAHTIQLSAHDVLKDLAQEVDECRNSVKKIRKSIKSGDIKMQMPILDNATRWNSTFEMLVSLINVRENIESPVIGEIITSEINWEFINNFVTAFKPLSLCTKQLQKEQYVIGDFYKDWLCCEIELEELFPVTPYASLLHTSMQSRKKLLLKNDAFIAALYLDPRFNFENSNFLSQQEKHTAVEHLIKTFDVFESLQKKPSENQNEFILNKSLLNQIELPTTSALAKLEQRTILQTTNTSSVRSHQTLKEKLLLLANFQKLPFDSDVLNYWKSNSDSDIKAIVEIALAVPATQVSVERAFSALPVVLTKLRSKLNDKTLSNLLITKLNYKELNPEYVTITEG